MTSRVQRIAPWQATKLFTLFYFIIGLCFSVLMALFVLAAPQAAAEGEITLGFVFVFPLLYALFALIFMPLCCLLYNLCAHLVGGIEIVIDERAA